MKYTIKDNLIHVAIIGLLVFLTIAWFGFLWIVIKYVWPILVALLFVFFVVEMLKTKRGM